MNINKRVRNVPVLLLFFTTALIATASSHAGFSGDLEIDAFMGTGYKVRAGGKGGQISRNDLLKCNSVGADLEEQTCPNDATYTPSSANGGYQAWGVGVAHLNLVVEDVECFLSFTWTYNWWSGEWQYGLAYFCEETEFIFPLGTFGRAMARVRWGDDDFGEPGGPVGPPGGVVPGAGGLSISTTAFWPNDLECDPFLDDVTNGGPVSPNRWEGKCNNTVDSNYVEEAGYEIELSFVDPMCRAGFGGRDHSSDDRDDGCFYYYHSSQESNLPSDYQDTTEFDDQQNFTIGFGSAAGDFIVPGFTYEVSQHFRSQVQPAMEGFLVTHSGSITTDVCALNVGFNFGFDALCHFSIDIASVGGNPDGFSKVVIPTNW